MNWVLQWEIMVKDFLDADISNNGFLRFVLVFYVFYVRVLYITVEVMILA